MWYLGRKMGARDEMQMKRASEDVETVRARKRSVEEDGIES